MNHDQDEEQLEWRDLAELIFGILLEDIRTERPAGFTADTPWPIDSNPHH